MRETDRRIKRRTSKKDGIIKTKCLKIRGIEIKLQQKYWQFKKGYKCAKATVWDWYKLNPEKAGNQRRRNKSNISQEKSIKEWENVALNWWGKQICELLFFPFEQQPVKIKGDPFNEKEPGFDNDLMPLQLK